MSRKKIGAAARSDIARFSFSPVNAGERKLYFRSPLLPCGEFRGRAVHGVSRILKRMDFFCAGIPANRKVKALAAVML